MLTTLNSHSLDKLPSQVLRPTYNRSDIQTGIVHIGLGNFHRSHQAIYLNRLFNQGYGHDWGITGAGIMPGDAKMKERLANQDFLYSVIELDPTDYQAEVCGSVIDFAEVSTQGIFKAMCRPEIRIVSLTITEGGYFIDSQSGGFHVEHATIQAERDNADDPQTVFGNIVKALKYRKDNGIAPFTVMSCDNLPENGHVTRNAVLGVADLVAPGMADWIAENVAFPNSMVDRITPVTSDRERQLVRHTFGYEDDCVVVCEPFIQWVIEDNFPQGRPALEKVGVEFVDDVAMYELMKLRILNAGHATIAYPSALLGSEIVHEAMTNDLVVAFLDKVQTEEAIPTIPPVPGVDFHQYFAKTKERFANPKIDDTIERLCTDGSNRQPKFIFQTIQDRLDSNQSVDGLALEVALWCRYCACISEQGDSYTINDVNADRLKENALKAKTDPSAFLGMTDIFGSLSQNAVFQTAFSAAIQSLWENGTEVTLKAYVSI